MPIVRFAAAGVAALAMVAGPAAAGQLYGASILESTSVWSIDGQRLMAVPDSSWVARPVPSGRHRLTIVDEGGMAVSEMVEFDEAKLAATRGDQFWCIAVALVDGKMVLIKMEQARCKAFIDAGN